MRIPSVALLSLLLLSACQERAPVASPSPAPAAVPAPAAAAMPAPETVAAPVAAESWWRCGEVSMSTRHRDEMLTLSGPFGERVLRPKETASGARYGDDDGNEFWSQGEDATLTLDWKQQDPCHRDPPAADG